MKENYLVGLSEEILEGYDKEKIGRVISQYRGGYKVLTEAGEVMGKVSGKLQYKALTIVEFPAVGDWVVFEEVDNTSIKIKEIVSRKSIILREAAGITSDEQILATNVDKIFITMSLNNNFNIRRLERYINMAWDSGAIPIIVLTKSDLCADIDDKLKEVEKVAISIEVIVISAIKEQGLDKIRCVIGKEDTVVFIGSSGVGKSTIINKLLGESIQLTKEIGEYDKGRHTTTSRELFFINDGGVIIDTPGMRELKLTVGDVDATFKDIEELAKECYFSDCKHKSEPRCAVKKAIENGELELERFNNYEKIMKELKIAEYKKKMKERKNEKRSKSK